MDWIIFCAVILLVRTHGQVKFRFNPLTAHTNSFTAALKLVYLAKIQTDYPKDFYRLHPAILQSNSVACNISVHTNYRYRITYMKKCSLTCQLLQEAISNIRTACMYEGKVAPMHNKLSTMQ
jgi:hypothetical protein